MTRARSELVSLEATPYYHCVSRCVRRAFLCGDRFEHRRGWVEDKLLTLAQVFCIDVAAYAVMSNHYHVVLHVDGGRAKALDAMEVVERWHQLFKGNSLSQRFARCEPLDFFEHEVLMKVVDDWRQRLCNISWFMRLINEGIARQANAEDHCTGRFWEGRFKCQALLDEQALAACMVYVDLNPIRANMARTPEQSNHTSAKKRCDHLKECRHTHQRLSDEPALMPFAGYPKEPMPNGIPFRLQDYLELVDWSGRSIRMAHNNHIRGAIAANQPAIMKRLAIAPDHWLYLCRHFESRFKALVGTALHVRKVAHDMGYLRSPSVKHCLLSG